MASRGKAPELGPGAGVERIYILVAGADIYHPIRYGGRKYWTVAVAGDSRR